MQARCVCPHGCAHRDGGRSSQYKSPNQRLVLAGYDGIPLSRRRSYRYLTRSVTCFFSIIIFFFSGACQVDLIHQHPENHPKKKKKTRPRGTIGCETLESNGQRRALRKCLQIPRLSPVYTSVLLAHCISRSRKAQVPQFSPRSAQNKKKGRLVGGECNPQIWVIRWMDVLDNSAMQHLFALPRIETRQRFMKMYVCRP